jgi:hypothetical protein
MAQRCLSRTQAHGLISPIFRAVHQYWMQKALRDGKGGPQVEIGPHCQRASNLLVGAFLWQVVVCLVAGNYRVYHREVLVVGSNIQRLGMADESENRKQTI